MSIEQKLIELNITLPTAPPAAGNYLPYVKAGNLLFLSGTLCIRDGKITHEGKVGKEHDIEAGYEAARICALNTLVNIKAALGDLDLVKSIVSVSGFVNGIDGFQDSPAVINGASDLFVSIFGERGKHSRAAVAVAGLPKNSLVEIQCIIAF